MILNKDTGCVYVFTCNGHEPRLEIRESTIIWQFRNYDDADYWHVEFMHGDAFDVFPMNQIVPDDVLIRIKNREAKLLIANSHEAFHKIVDGIYKSLVIREQIPPEQIVLMSESADIYDEVKIIAQKYNLAEIKCEWVLEFEWAIQQQKKDFPLVNTLEDKHYQKKFINFNRRWRLHRPTLVAIMKAIGVLHLGHVSLGDSDDNNNWDRMWWWVKAHNSTNQTVRQLFTNHEQAITSMPPLYIDTTDLHENKAWLDASTDYLYEQTYFSVVSETNFYNDPMFETGRFLSEKTFKPVAMKHPFIVTSVPNILDKIREIGYKTFHPYIDESYDTETNDQERLLKIANETKRLSLLTPDELTEFLNNVRPIVEHNYNLLMTKQQFVHKLN